MKVPNWLRAGLIGAVVASAGAWSVRDSIFAQQADESKLEVRQWSDASGKFKIDAAFLEFKDNKVRLLRADGSETSIQLTKLSKEDQAYVKAEQTRRREDAKTKKSSGEAAAGGGEWSQWRGPHRDGISPEKGLLQDWPAEGPELVWQTKGLGGGFSSVAVSQGKLFTSGERGGKVELIALDAKNGEPIWAAEIGGGQRPNSTPTVDGDLVFALGFDGDLICAETATGKVVWKKNFGRDFGGQMMSGWGYSESLLVDGDHLICTPGSKDAMLAALNKRTGEVVWKTAVAELGPKGGDGAAYASVMITNAGGVKQYVQFVGRGLIGVDAKSGKLLWNYNPIANGTANIPTVLIKDDLVFCSSGYGTGSALLKLSGKGGQVQAEEVYFLNANVAQNHHGGMILLGDHVYMGHAHNEGFPLCLELKTGKETWRPGRGPGRGSAAVSFADGQLYFRYEDGTMALIEATPKAYKLNGKFELPSKLDKSWQHPTISGGKLYLRDQDVLLVYDIRRKA